MAEMNSIETANDLARDLLKEKRSEKRWRNIRFVLWFLLITYVVFNLLHKDVPDIGVVEKKHAALIRLDGMIAPGRDISADSLIPVLRKAFKDKSAEGVVLDINSPGGTPVQAAIIHDAILRFKKQYSKKVIVVGEDMLTSGAYYVAVAADKIYVNPNTLTGSVGVIVKGFGFVDLMQKLGVERRVYTSGTDKDRLDPFMPQTESDVTKIKEVMAVVQKNFAQAVIDGRKGKLKKSPEELFTGDFWSGSTALELGLVDANGNLMDAMEKEFGTTKYTEYGGRPAFLRMLMGTMSSSVDTMFYGSL